MPLTNTDRRRLRQALRIAIDYQDSLIDAHRVAYPKRGQGEKIIPPDFRADTDRWKRDIDAFQRLHNKLDKEAS